MDEFSGGKVLLYKSRNIMERRQRLLREARKLIAEVGVSGFSVKELCARAEISQVTLYNAFGSKEKVVAMAIRQAAGNFAKHVTYYADPATIGGRLERLIKIHSRNRQIKPYMRAIVAVHNSDTADRELRSEIRKMRESGLEAFVEAIEARKAFAPGVTREAFIENETTVLFAILSDWILGDIADDRLVDRIAEAFLINIMGMMKGEVVAEARRWLRDMRENTPTWQTFRQMAEAPSSAAPDAAPAPARRTARSSRKTPA